MGDGIGIGEIILLLLFGFSLLGGLWQKVQESIEKNNARRREGSSGEPLRREDLSPEARRQIYGDQGAQFYGFDEDDEAEVTPVPVSQGQPRSPRPARQQQPQRQPAMQQQRAQQAPPPPPRPTQERRQSSTHEQAAARLDPRTREQRHAPAETSYPRPPSSMREAVGQAMGLANPELQERQRREAEQRARVDQARQEAAQRREAAERKRKEMEQQRARDQRRAQQQQTHRRRGKLVSPRVMFGSTANVRNGIVFSEIISQPVSLRQPRY